MTIRSLFLHLISGDQNARGLFENVSKNTDFLCSGAWHLSGEMEFFWGSSGCGNFEWDDTEAWRGQGKRCSRQRGLGSDTGMCAQVIKLEDVATLVWKFFQRTIRGRRSEGQATNGTVVAAF